MNKDYWKRAGNPRIGWQMLMNDIKRGFEPRRQVQSKSNNMYKDEPRTCFTDRYNQDTNRQPSVVNNFTYNTAPAPMNQRKFGFMDVGKIILITLLCGICVAVGWMLITNPQALVDKIHSLIDVVKSVL